MAGPGHTRYRLLTVVIFIPPRDGGFGFGAVLTFINFLALRQAVTPAPPELQRFFTILERDCVTTRSVAHYAKGAGVTPRRSNAALAAVATEGASHSSASRSVHRWECGAPAGSGFTSASR